MRVVERYILVQLALAYGLISLLLLGLFGFFDLSTQLDDVGKGVYSTADALIYTAFGLPQRVVDIMPFTALLATIATLGIMAQRRELVILRGAGISALRIAATIGKAGMVLLAVNIVLQSTIAPNLQQRAQRLRASALAGQHADFSNSFWVRSRRGVVHVGGLRNGRVPIDIEFFGFADNHTLTRYMHAASADALTAHNWRLHDVIIKRFGPRGDQTVHRAMRYWDPALYPDQLKILNQSPAALSPQALYRYIGYLRSQGQNAEAFRVALWQKLAVLPTTLAMMLFAIPLTFANPRGTQFGFRLVVGGLIGLGVYSAGQATADLALLLDINPAPMTLTPALVFIMLALGWLRRLS